MMDSKEVNSPKYFMWCLLLVVAVTSLYLIWTSKADCELSVYEVYNSSSGAKGAQGFAVHTFDCDSLKANCENTKDYMNNPCEWRESLNDCQCYTGEHLPR